jgi:hypothetical protein
MKTTDWKVMRDISLTKLSLLMVKNEHGSIDFPFSPFFALIKMEVKRV